MNKSYKSVWNESTGSWVAVSELATGRSKSKRAKTAISKAILAQVAVGGMSLAGAGAAMAADTATLGTGATSNISDGVAIGLDSLVDVDTKAPTKIGGMAIGDSAYAMGSGIAIGANSQASTDSFAFGPNAIAGGGGTSVGANSYTINDGGLALGKNASAVGAGAIALGMNSSASGSGSLALGQGSVTTASNTVSVGNATLQRKIVNLAAGTTTTDAVNLGQLTAAGLNVDTNGKATNSFVAYDTTAMGKVTLGGGTAGTTITNVKAGTTTTDAVNLGQLTAAGITVDTNGKATNAFVAYDSTAKTGVTLGAGTAGAQIHNLVAGTTATDAVNLGQLTAAGLTVDTAGKATNAFVAYDTTAKAKVTLGGGTAGTTLSNVKAGTTATDAVNLGQLTAAGITVDTNGKATNAFVAYDSTAKNSVTLGGGTAGTTITNLKAGIANSDAVAVSQLKSAGFALDASGNVTTPAVVYTAGSIASGKPNVTLNAGTGNSPYFKNGDRKQGLLPVGTVISNVANGIQDTDAASVGQVNDIVNQTGGSAPSLLQGGLLQATSTGSGVVTTGLGTSYKTAAYYSQVAGMGDATGSTPPSDVARAEGLASIAVGSNAYAKGASSTAVGVQAYTSAADAVALGSGSVANTANTVSIGNDGTGSYTAYDAQGAAYTIKNQANTRRLVNMAAGIAATDAVNVGQLTAAGLAVDTAGNVTNSFVAYDSTAKTKVTLGGGTAGTTITNVKAGASSATSTDAINGSQLFAVQTDINALKNAPAASNPYVSIGALANNAGPATSTVGGDIAIGVRAKAVGAASPAIAIGTDANALATLSTAIGTTATASANGDTAIGSNALATGGGAYSSATAIGYAANATGSLSSALGRGASATGASSVALGANSVADQDKTVSVGSSSLKRKIVNVAAGTSTNDAVNFGQLTAAGLNVDTNGNATNSFVAYDTTAMGKVTLGGGTAGTTITNVKAGTTATDAVNLGQLTAAGLNVDTNGKATNSFVAYDTTAMGKVTLGGGTAGTTITNVKAGTTTTDAVNLGQLTAAGLNVDTNGKATNSFVAYDTTAMGKVTLGGGTAGTTITNVKAGTTTTDAVNLGQLTAAGITFDTTGKATNAFVAYDSTAKTGVTLGAGTAGAQIHNLVAGTTTTDAVNLGQLTAAGLTVDTAGKATNAFVAYDTTAKAKVTLGGGTAGTTLSNVKAGTTATDAVNLGQLTAAGITVDTNGKATNAFVAYDSTAKNSVTLGGGTAGTTITNLKAGIANSDAVAVSQLKSAGFTLDASGNVTTPAVVYTAGSIASGKPNVTLNAGTGNSTYFRNGDRKQGLLPVGTVISNVANGIQDTDAASVGQVNDIVNQTGSASPQMVQGVHLLQATSGSGVVTTGLALSYKTAAYYSQVAGMGDATGSTPPSDVARAEGLASIAVGSNAYAKGTSSTAVGVQAYTSAADAVALGSGSVANTANTVSVGNDGTSSYTAYDAQGVAYTIKNQANTRRLLNMAAGQNDTDAVNVGQLKGVTAAIGGGAAVGPDGKVVAPTFEVNGQNYDTIADAINAAAVSGGGTDANAVAYDSTAKTKVTLGGGTAGTTIANVKAGAADMDAVNLAQLKAAGLNVDTAGNVTNTFVAYDSTAMGKVTLGGGTAGTTIANVKAGAADMDAVNLAQLKAAGLSVDTAGKVTNSFVAYDSTAMGKVTLGGGTAGTTIANVKAGTTATDAVNLGQLTAAGLTVDTNGKATNAFVAYDTTAKGKITLGGGSAGTTIANVKAGAADMDAVNLAQLKAAGFNVDTNGNPTNAFVAYDTTAKTGVTLGSGSAGAQIHNLVAGTTATDAVNLAQLTAAGLNVDTAGNATNSFVAYDSTAMDKVTLGGGAAGTTITNVKAGTTATDAVNFSQLKPVVDALGGGAAISAAGVVTGPTYSINNHKSYNVGDAFKDVDQGLSDLNSAVAAITADTGGAGLVAQDATTRNITVGKLTDGTVVDMTNSSGVQRTITGVAAGAVNSSSFDAINGSQLAGVSSSFATAIGGGAMMNPDGSITQPSFSVGGDTVHNVGDAITNLDGRVTSNTDSLVNLQTTVNNITNGGGIANPNAVAYDSSAHDQITLAGNGTAGTKLTGLAAGDISSADSTDAVTGGQLYATNAEVAALQNTVQNFNTTGTAGIGINGKDGKDGAPAAAASANGSDAIAMGDNASASGDHAIVIGGGATGTNDGVIAIGGNAGASGKDSIAIGNGASAPADNAVALGAHSVADRDNTVSVGSAGNERQITNVAAGTQGTDAVNLNQMNSAVGGIARKAYSGIAAATALTMIPDVDANKTLSIGIGGGTFQGYAATAIGGTARITQNIKVRVGAGWSAAGTTVGAGASYQW